MQIQMWLFLILSGLTVMTHGFPDRTPGSDNWFDCGDGSFITAMWICDGENDCGNWKDEQDCIDNSCTNSTCSQQCESTPSGPRCYCNDGYMLDTKDNATCLDVDECQIDGFCSHSCTNLLGGYNCSCMEGYRLVNRTKCQAEGADPLLFFSTLDEIRGIRLRSRQYFLVQKAIQIATAFDVDPTSERIFWIELSNKSTIYSAKINGGGDMSTVLEQGLLLPEDIAVDYVAGNLYLTDSRLHQVLACKMDGTICHVLHDDNVDKPRSILLDLSESFLYWSDFGAQTAGIYRSGMDGSKRINIVTKDIGRPNGMAIDHTIDKLFWADAKRKTIESISLDGSSRKVVLYGSVFHPYSLTVFEDNIYWSDWSTFSLESCNKFTGHKTRLIARENGKHIMGVHVYHPVLARKESNPCRSSQCSHLCLLSPKRSFRCACPPGFGLSSDTRTCTMLSWNSPALLVSEDSTVFYILPDAVGSKAIMEIPLPLHSLKITKVAYDSIANVLYIADTNGPAIHAMNMTTLRTWELVKYHLISPEDIAVDAANLYWVDSSKGTVEVISVVQQQRATLVEGLELPFSIAISRFGYMFIASIRSASISMYDMDGNNPKILRSVVGYPMSVAVHPTKSLLYWANSEARTIAFINFTSSSTSLVAVRRIKGIMSVVSSEESLYWTTGKREIHFRKYNTTHVIALPGQQRNDVIVRKITYSPGFQVADASPCSINNGGCSHLCLLPPRGRTCLCPLGMMLAADNTSCVDNICSGDDFRCRNGRCIIKSSLCDGRDDCGDNSDEMDCPEQTCSMEQIQCGDGKCISKLWRCDGETDCTNGVDESECNTTRCNSNSEFRCNSGQCLPLHWRCDRTNDCFDGTDEKDCNISD